ncbi:hypothetical protein T12_11290, partial [Trichinella patagoniensis]
LVAMAAEVGGWEEVQRADAYEKQDVASNTESEGLGPVSRESKEKMEGKVKYNGEEKQQDASAVVGDDEGDEELHCRHHSSDSDTKSNGSGNNSDNSSKSAPQCNSKEKAMKKK